MNEKAKEIGATDTVYVEPTGIDDNAQTTAYDTMLVSKEFMSRALLMELSSAPSYNVSNTNKSNARTLYNRNALISNRTSSKYLNSSAKGLNAGMTSGGGYCVITSAKKDDRTYICVVMGATYDDAEDNVYSYVIANELLDHIDRSLGYEVLIKSNTEICKIPIVGAEIKKENVSVGPTEDVKVYLPSNYAESGMLRTSYIYYTDQLTAPVSKGTVVGKIVVSYNDEILSVSDIVVSEDVERDGFVYSLAAIKNVASSRGAIAGAICFASLLAICFLIRPMLRTKQRRKRMGKYRYK